MSSGSPVPFERDEGASTPAADRRSTSRAARLRRKLFRVLTWSERQSGAGVATISCGGTPVGDILVARGRLCLVIPARGCVPRDAVPLDPALAELVHRSQLEGGISAAVAGEKDDALGTVRRGLLTLIGADLACVLGATAEQSFDGTLRPAAADYDSRLTFSAAEAYVATLAHALGALSRLEAGLVRTTDCRSLLVLLRGTDRQEGAYPIAARGFDGATLHELVQACRSAMELSRESTSDVEILSLADGEEVSHYVSGPVRLVAVRAERSQSEAALSRALLLAGGR